MSPSIYKKPQRIDVWAILMMGAAIILAAGILGAYWYVKTTRPVLDADYCPKSGILGQTVVLLDISEPLTQKQQEALDGLLRDFSDPTQSEADLRATGLEKGARYVQPGEALVFYTTEPAPKLATQLLRLCNPGGSPSERNIGKQLTEGAVQENRWRTFQRKVQAAFPSTLRQTVQPTSPLLETIALLVERHTESTVKRAAGKSIPTRLVVFSDMLQNSSALSQFKELPDWNALSKKATFAEMSADLTGVEVSIFYLRRTKYAAVQTPAHYGWWPDVIRRMSGRVVYMEPV